VIKSWKDEWPKKLIGTHRSYHKRISFFKQFKRFAYQYGPVSEQLSNGIRDIHLDLHWNMIWRRVEVYNNWIDRGTYYADFKDLLREVGRWSLCHNNHHPIVISISIRGRCDFIGRVEDCILQYIPRNKIYIQLPSNRNELVWEEKRPRGKIIFLLMNEDECRDDYINNNGYQRVLMTLAYRNDLKKNDKNVFIHYPNPVRDFDEINRAYELGYIIKTNINRRNNQLDFKQAMKACQSKAHILLTNYPFIFNNDADFIYKVLKVWGDWPMAYEEEE